MGLVDKEYNLTIQNLENRERSLDIDAFFKAITGGLDNIVSGSIKLSYLTTLTKTVDEFTESCTSEQITLSRGESNETTRTINKCVGVNNPKTVTYQGWKAYPVNEVRDNVKQEITLQKTDNNGKIILLPNSIINLNLAFKTRVVERSDGTYGNDGEFGLLLDGILYHPTFNTSYKKRYLVNITTNDAINNNFTHNITIALTGSSTEIGSGNIFRANVSVLGCSSVHVIFNETREIDREIENCNSSNMRIYFRNQVNMTRNQILPENYSIYYDPVGSDQQPPRDWSAIWLIGSAHFDDGQNDTLYQFDNATQGNATWRNISGNGYVELRGESNPSDGCLIGKDITNTTEPNIVIEFLLQRVNAYTEDAGNKAFGLNDRLCHTTPNTAATGFFIKDSPAGLDNNFASRSANDGNFTSSTLIMGKPQLGTWQLVGANRTTTSGFNTNITGFFVTTNSTLTIHDNITTNIPISSTPLRPLLRTEREGPGVANFNLDEIRLIQLVASPPSYIVLQQNSTADEIRPDVTLNNPPNATSNTSTNHKFNANMSDNVELKTATLYHNISGTWQANQTVNISGSTNSTNFSVANMLPGTYEWNVQVCDTSNLCKQANSNFTFKVQAPVAPIAIALKVRSCVASENNFGQGTYDDPCDANYSVAATCGSNGTINDFLSCDDGNAETHSYNKNRFGGVHIQTFNSSITDCSSIGDVLFCYEWWTTGGDSVNCTIEVDANGNSSFTKLPANTCPGAPCPSTMANPGVSCFNVTSLENWTCGNFFGSNGTRAVARNLIGKSDIGAETLSTDAFFFNVSYTPT